MRVGSYANLFHEEFEFTRVLSITRFNCSQILSAATESSQL